MSYIPICFSQQFTNKQNLRSFKNTINFKILKSDGDIFLQYILEDQFLIKEISLELKEILNNLKQNIKKCSKENFEFYFSKSIEFNNFEPLDKLKIFFGCCTILLKIIPSSFFGNNHNNKIFKKCVKTIIYSMNHQHFNFCNMVNHWDLSIYPWNTLSENVSFKVLYLSLLWILKKLLSSIIILHFHVTNCKMDTDENKLYFFWKNQWQRFYDKKISAMVITKVIKKFEPYSLGNKIKRKYSLQERLKIKCIIREIPKLHIILKNNNEYRPIVRYKNNENNSLDKNITKERLRFLRKLTGKPHEKIENMFLSFVNRWIAKKKPKLYFIKTDLSNAFGSINRLKLLKMLSEKHAIFQKEQMTPYLKKKFEQNYKDLIIELKKPLLIRTGSTIYEWKEGLVQGYKLSPALSELYYSCMDEVYFSHHLKRNDELKLFTRVVDDYLYITDSLEDACSFMKALSSYHNVNYNKTVINFPLNNIKFSRNIVFLGYSYNTHTMEVSRVNTACSGQMCFKIGFSPAIVDMGKFLENRIGQSGIEINSHIFNFFYNSEELIWNHIFVTLCLSANKFCTILAILCNDREMYQYIPLYKKKVTVKLCNTIIDTLRRSKPLDFMFTYCINHFRYLSFKALILCAQNTPRCNKLVPYITIELQKSNCLFGKWREHSSRICENGFSTNAAIKEVCKRSDLKRIFKNFEVLPEGFCCFNKESLQV